MKVYINPEIKIVRLVQNRSLMDAVSSLGKGSEFNGSSDVVLSRRGDSIWDDEEEY